MKLACLWLWLLLVLWLAPHVRAQHTGVFPVHGTNLSDSESGAIGALFGTAYAEQAQVSVLSPAELRGWLAQAGTETRVAEQLGLYEYVHLEAVRLNTRIVLSAQLRDTHGRSLYEVRDTAFSLDDMELVTLRMAAALVHRVPVEAEGRLGASGLAGAQAPRKRVFSEKLFGVRFGLVMPWARHLETQASMLAQFDVRLEQRHYFVELAIGFWLPSRTNANQGLGGWVGQLGASYYLSQGSVSPYVGVGVSPRLFAGEYSGAGLAANAQVGVMLMRESSTRLYAELRVDQNLMRARQRGPSVADGGRETVVPTEISAAVGLGF